MKTNYLLTGTNPPQWLSDAQVTDAARRAQYQPRHLARELGLTPRTFERRFRRAFGCAPREWLAVEQMREAATLLARGFNTKEIAAALGYGHPPSFFREFRRQFGCTTTEWQERLRPAREADVWAGAGRLSQNAIILSQTAISPALRLTEAV